MTKSHSAKRPAPIEWKCNGSYRETFIKALEDVDKRRKLLGCRGPYIGESFDFECLQMNMEDFDNYALKCYLPNPFQDWQLGLHVVRIRGRRGGDDPPLDWHFYGERPVVPAPRPPPPPPPPTQSLFMLDRGLPYRRLTDEELEALIE